MRSIDYSVNDTNYSIIISEEIFNFWGTVEEGRIRSMISSETVKNNEDMSFELYGLKVSTFQVAMSRDKDDILQREFRFQIYAIKRQYDKEIKAKIQLENNRKSMKRFKSSSRKQKKFIDKCNGSFRRYLL